MHEVKYEEVVSLKMGSLKGVTNEVLEGLDSDTDEEEQDQ